MHQSELKMFLTMWCECLSAVRFLWRHQRYEMEDKLNVATYNLTSSLYKNRTKKQRAQRKVSETTELHGEFWKYESVTWFLPSVVLYYEPVSAKVWSTNETCPKSQKVSLLSHGRVKSQLICLIALITKLIINQLFQLYTTEIVTLNKRTEVKALCLCGKLLFITRSNRLGVTQIC